jgi:uncharacterized protein YjbI with pentapeptide repeats
MANQQAEENDTDAPVTSSPQPEDHDAAAAICGEKSHTVVKQLVSRSKQPGRFKRLWRRSYAKPPWWVEQIFGAGIVGLLVASLVGGATVLSGKYFSDIQARQAQHFSDIQARQTLQLENLRFVRDRAAAAKPDEPFPFAGLDLEGQDLRELTLPHANFENANLTRAYLVGADLSGADLVHVSLRGAWLDPGDLEAADLCAADLTDARFDEASLRDAVLGGADLTRASFQDADLTGAKFGSSDKMFFCKAAPNLTETDLCSSNLAGADLKRASNLMAMSTRSGPGVTGRIPAVVATRGGQ